MKVYLSVPLVANRDRERAAAMARAIEDSGHEVTSPWVLDSYRRHKPEELNVFKRDKSGVESCDVIVADASSPSIGVGMEVMVAYHNRKGLIAAARRGSPVSGMLLHMDGLKLVEYGSNDELYAKLRELLERYGRAESTFPQSR